MNTVKYAAYLAVLMVFTPSHAKVTVEQAMKESRDGISPPSYYNDANNTAWNNTLPQPPQSGGSVSTHYARNTTVKLKPTSSYICVVGRLYGYYHRGLKGIEIDVYQSGGYWYLKAASPNSDNIGEATCWSK